MTETMLDTKGLNCPLPILKAKRALAGMSAGAMLRVVATDPVARRDFPAFCHQTGHELIQTGEPEIGVFEFLIKKAS